MSFLKFYICYFSKTVTKTTDCAKIFSLENYFKCLVNKWILFISENWSWITYQLTMTHYKTNPTKLSKTYEKQKS